MFDENEEMTDARAVVDSFPLTISAWNGYLSGWYSVYSNHLAIDEMNQLVESATELVSTWTSTMAGDLDPILLDTLIDEAIACAAKAYQLFQQSIQYTEDFEGGETTPELEGWISLIPVISILRGLLTELGSALFTLRDHAHVGETGYFDNSDVE